MNRTIVCASYLAALVCSFATLSAIADGTKPVTKGPVIRGVTLPGPVGARGTPTGRTCDFAGEDVAPSGTMTGASVNCGAGRTAQDLVNSLPPRFNAYCIVSSADKVKSARIIAAPIPGNADHCDLSGIKPNDAASQFKGALWR